MKTVFARAVVALSLVSLPASAITSSKTKGTHHHTADTADAPAEKPTKHHHHNKTAKTSKPAKSGFDSTAVASHHSHKDKAPVASKSVPAEPLKH